MPKVSIIIPMYNAEKYIRQCLESVRRQTFSDYEVIVVDDHSSDQSVSIVESVKPFFDGRLRLFKRNSNSGGGALPRNFALKHARGDYVFFLDADDAVTPNALQTVFDAALSTNADIVHSEKCYRPSTVGAIEPPHKLYSLQVGAFVDKLTVDTVDPQSPDLSDRVQRFCQRKMWWLAWNNLIRRQLLVDNRIEFPQLKSTEDWVFFFQCLCCARVFVRIPDVFYIYRQTPGSITQPTHGVDRRMQRYASILVDGVKVLDKFTDRLDYFKRNPQHKYLVLNYFVRSNVEWESWIYSRTQPHTLNELVSKELLSSPADTARLTPYLFSLTNMLWLQSRQLQMQNNQLKEQVARLQSESDSRAGARQLLRTWDIFDTLIARRCVQPERVFAIVEQRIKVKGFAAIRLKAERVVQLRGKPYKLADIYDTLRQSMKLDPKLVERWQRTECEVELEQAIPIVENINRVQSGDVLISDMYLPEDVIRRMLTKCGLFVPVELVVTNHAKSDGSLWRQLSAQGVSLFHTGDNQQSDVGKPREYQFESEWSMLHRPTPLEDQLIKIDFEFGAYLRALRLANPFCEDVKRNYWTLFTLNVGILMLIAQLIDRVQRAYGFEYLGFCGRDMYYLRQIYRRLKESRGESPTPNGYLYYSRKLIKHSEAELIKYFASELGGRRALLIDLTGSGVHLRMLRDKSKLRYSILLCMLIGRTESARIYPELEKFLSVEWTGIRDVLSKVDAKSKPPENLCMFDLERDEIPIKDNIELFNRATHNSPIRLTAVEVAGKVVPEVTFTEVNDTENLDVFEACMREVLRSTMQFARIERTDNLLTLLKSMLIVFENSSKRVIFKRQQNIQEITERMLSEVARL